MPFESIRTGVFCATRQDSLHKSQSSCQDMTEEQVKEMMMAVDADGSGEIDFDEFVCLVVSRMEHAMMNDEAQVGSSADLAFLSALLQVRKAFNVFDGDGVGQISTSSLQAALAKR